MLNSLRQWQEECLYASRKSVWYGKAICCGCQFCEATERMAMLSSKVRPPSLSSAMALASHKFSALTQQSNYRYPSSQFQFVLESMIES
eukprot:3700813-Amphidinium_carterae.1